MCNCYFATVKKYQKYNILIKMQIQFQIYYKLKKHSCNYNVLCNFHMRTVWLVVYSSMPWTVYNFGIFEVICAFITAFCAIYTHFTSIPSKYNPRQFVLHHICAYTSDEKYCVYSSKKSPDISCLNLSLESTNECSRWSYIFKQS